MGFLLLLISGAAAGMITAHLMRVKVHIFTAMAFGIAGTVIGMIALRLLAGLVNTAGGIAFVFVSGVIGAAVLIWLYQKYLQNR